MLLHAVLFAMFGLSVLIAMRKGGGNRFICRNAWGLLLVGGMLMAAVLELAQGAVFPDRGSDVGDLLADFVGLLLAGCAFRALYLMWPMGKQVH